MARGGEHLDLTAAQVDDVSVGKRIDLDVVFAGSFPDQG